MLGLGNIITGGAALDEFTPANIANLALWLKNGTGVTAAQWDDSSGNDNHVTQGTSGNQAAVSGGGLDFEAGDADHYDFTKITISTNHNFLIGFVVTPETLSTARHCVLSDDNNEFVDFTASVLSINCTGTTSAYTGGSAIFADSTKAAVVISRNDSDTGTFQIFINGSTPAGSWTNETNNKAIEFDTLGVRNANQRPLDGIISELVVYDFGTGTHTADELTALKNYLSNI